MVRPYISRMASMKILTLLFFFKPQCVIETLIPSIVLIFVNNFGAKGEIFEGMVLHLTKLIYTMLMVTLSGQKNYERN